MREARATNSHALQARTATVEIVTHGDAALVTISGTVNERFAGFGPIGSATTVVIDVGRVTRMTSFGVRQWLKAMDAIPKTVADLYLLDCTRVFVDQLNMVLNFGGAGKVLTVVAPYTCPSCGDESHELIDVLVERANLAKGVVRDKACARCDSVLELVEMPETYFAFAAKYGATSIAPSAAVLLASHDRYTSSDTSAEKPPRIVKFVHGKVTYFRIMGTIGSMFRARPFLVGAESEVVIDLAEVGRFDPTGRKEWRRLLTSLSEQVRMVTLVDVTEPLLSAAADNLALPRNIGVATMVAPHRCRDCGRISQEAVRQFDGAPELRDRICPTCGGTTRSELAPEMLAALAKLKQRTPADSANVIEQRAEHLARAVDSTRATPGASHRLRADDVILGKYKIVRKLSTGGMAEVFLANQIGIGGFEKPVALKRIQHSVLASRRQAIELFLNEAKIAGRLMHPNIVQVLDVGEVKGSLYLAMEYIHGRDLRDVGKALRARATTMPLSEACYIVREVAQALHHAYWSTDMAGNRLSVVHRDVSPHNIILGYEGTVKLLDFGVAMSAITEHPDSLIVGKWTYMSPETTMNGQSDHRSDLFSLGVILYLLVSGVTPFSGSEPNEIVRKIRAGDYIPLAEVAPNVPERLASLVARLLAPNPDDRPQLGSDVVAELQEIMQQHNIKSSAAAISELLAHTFPATGDSSDDAPTAKIVRSQPRDSATPLMSALILARERESSRTNFSPPERAIPREPSPARSPTLPARSSIAKHPVAPRTKTDRIINITIALVLLILLIAVAQILYSHN